MSLAFGDFVFDHERRELRRGDTVLKVDPLQLDLLACFLANSGRLLSKQELLDQVWEGRAVADNVLSVTVAKLRKVLGHNPGEREFIENRYGRGYRFLPAVSLVDTPAPRSSQPPPVVAPTSVRAPNPPLVGRVESRQRLEAALARALAGKGSLCVLIGEPGIGKTRLAESLESTARSQGANPVWGRYQPMENAPPLWPFVQALRELNSDGLANDILRYLEERTLEYEKRLAAAESTSAITREYAFEASSHSHRTVDETSQALIRLSKQRPIVLLLDDLQWADAMSMRLLNYLVDDIARWPLLVVATLRSEGPAEESRNRDLSRLLRHRNCERIELARLHESDIREYVTAVFGRSGPDVSQIVFTRSEGNPFFMVELLRPWEGRSGPIDPEQLQLSGLAQELLRQRVQALPPDSRKVLSAAAVIGHDFDLGLLGHVSERTPDELLEALDGSLANDTVIPSAEVSGAYAFDHELIREVLYTELPVKERCRLHLRAGEGLARRRTAGGEVSSAELAHHFLAALPQGNVAHAIAIARTAALAAHRSANARLARILLRRALASLSFWVEPDLEVRTALLLELSMVERTLGDTSHIEHLAQGVALAREHGFGVLLTVAGQFLSWGPGLISQPEAADVLQAAIDVLPQDDDRRRAIALAHLAWTPPNCTSARRVNELMKEAEERAKRSNAMDARAAVSTANLFFKGGPKTVQVAETIAAEVEREVRDLPLGTSRGRMLPVEAFRMISAMQRGDRAAVARAMEKRAALLAQLNNPELDWHHERYLLVQRMNEGEFAGAAEEIARLRARAERFRFQAWREILALDFGRLLLETADVREFAARVKSGLAISKYDLPSNRSRKLRAMADFGLHDELREALALVSVESLHDLPSDRDSLVVLCNLAQACVVAGSPEQCRALYELLSPYAELYAVDIAFHCDGAVSYFLGKLAQRLGRDADALALYEAAIERNQKMGLRPAEVHARFALGCLLLDSTRVKDVTRGREALALARDTAAQIGFTMLANAAAQRLERP